jgi:hypothetical protein
MSIYSDVDFRTYAGPALERGGTDPQAKGPSPALRRLVNDGRIVGRVLDYGAGKAGRNATYLRSLGHEVYAYDPFNGADADGWTAVSRTLPDVKFDTGLTSFVLNVVPQHVQEEICRNLRWFTDRSFHITRNLDVAQMIERALRKPDSIVSRFFLDYYADDILRVRHQRGDLDMWDIEAFARFGTATSRGFQRIPTLERSGWTLLHETSGWKLYG